MKRIRQHTVQLRHPGGGVGTGALVGEGLILTALHCVFPMEDGAPLPDIVPQNVPCPQVRLIADLASALGEMPDLMNFDFRRINVPQFVAHPGAAFHDCTLVWPPAGAQMPNVDVAILKMTPDAMAQSNAANAALSFKIGAAEGQEMTLVGEGFPDFATIHLGPNALDFREVYNLFGATRSTRGVFSGMQMNVQSAQPENVRDWAGLSGTVLWQDNIGQPLELIGVVSNTKSRIRQNNALYFTSLSQLKNDPVFWDVLGRTIDDTQNTPPNPAEQLITFDRTMPRHFLSEWMRQDLAMPASNNRRDTDTEQLAPLVVVLTGHNVDELNLFVSSALHEMERSVGFAMGAEAPTLSVRYLPGAPPDTALQAALLAWGRGLGLHEPGQIPDPNAIARALEDETQPQVVVMEHIDTDISESCLAVLRQVLTVFSSVRPSVLTGRTPPVLFLAFSKGRDKLGVDEGFQAGALFDDKINALPAVLSDLKAEFPRLNWSPDFDLCVPQCTHFDMADWLDALEDAGLRVSGRLRMKIEDRTLNQDMFPMYFARHLINETFSTDIDE
ncbi:hypothetical protein [Ascidiaceihabitans sp.]|uniref:hypothetical protein n=1 Tax=Ascidiaceihabitans sp. TaxID=1872644 RepID=UPI0032973A4E